METTQEKIISLELTTSPLTDEAPNSISSELEDLQADSLQPESLQTDIIQVVNPLLDGMSGQVTSISVAPPYRVTTVTKTEEILDRDNLRLELNETFVVTKSNGNSIGSPEPLGQSEDDLDENETPATTPDTPTNENGSLTSSGKKKKRKRSGRKGKN